MIWLVELTNGQVSVNGVTVWIHGKSLRHIYIHTNIHTYIHIHIHIHIYIHAYKFTYIYTFASSIIVR